MCKTDFVLRACCGSSPEKTTFLERQDTPSIGREIVREAVQADFIPDPVVAWHEAGHATVGIMVGMIPEAILAGAGGFVTWRDQAPSRSAEIVMLLAGDFAGGMAVRTEHRPVDGELSPWLDLVRKPAGGYCDRCRIIRALVIEHGVDASDAAILSAYREAEARTLETLHRMEVRGAIRAIAGELMGVGRLTGDAVTEIASRYVVPGSLVGELK